MKNLLATLIIFISNMAFCQDGVFRDREVIKYTVKYETAAFVSYDTIRIFVTGKMWKAAPNTSKEIVISYDLENIIFRISKRLDG